jgi:uncharacterized protein (TIGR02453 family)
MNSNHINHFLRELAANNNRQWFGEHKAEYEAIRDEFEAFLAAAIGRISLFDDSIRSVQPKDCTYRIYRDTRFSPDKTPYKTHIGGYINGRGKKSFHGGYYIHLEPGNSMLAGGSICLPTPVIRAVRQSIYDNIDEYISIVEAPAFKKIFPVVGDNCMKMAPKGFPKDFEHIDYLKCREFTCYCPVADDFWESPAALERLEEVFRQLKPYTDFINYAIDEIE